MVTMCIPLSDLSLEAEKKMTLSRKDTLYLIQICATNDH